MREKGVLLNHLKHNSQNADQIRQRVHLYFNILIGGDLVGSSDNINIIQENWSDRPQKVRLQNWYKK